MKISNRSLKCNAYKAGAILKCIPFIPIVTINFINACGYGYAGKIGTTLKSSSSNSCNTVRYGYIAKTATIKNHITNVSNTIWYDYVGKVGAICKSAISNTGKIGVAR